jgi:archaellum biogenesis ATPase FlaH
MYGFDNASDRLKNLGKHKTGRSCLYINKLDDINIDVLKDLISDSFKYMKKNFQT